MFEKTELEDNTISIGNLDNDIDIKPYSKTVLDDPQPMKPLEYLLKFLDAYNFNSEDSEKTQGENKTLISASVLGLIFEKINGYKDGSYFTPSYITEYICRETIKLAVIQKFNETKGWNCKTIEELYNKIQDNEIERSNEIFNSLRILDPAVGSGHFLVSALNEMIYLKSELGILSDKKGKRLKDYHITVENDELKITNDGKYFVYNRKDEESQRVQEALFHAKQIIIENCLFGVDINPNSVKICQLRLWIELLKHTYYRTDGTLETLPNIDINIKCGNSLLSMFALDDKYGQLKGVEKKVKETTQKYKELVFFYKQRDISKEYKRQIVKNIENEKNFLYTINNPQDSDYQNLQKARNELTEYMQSLNFAVQDNQRNNTITELTEKVNQLEKVYNEKKRSCFEWRFEFPEVLDDDGNFVGFDVIIGNPPYLKEGKISKSVFEKYNKLPYYQGKIDLWYIFACKGIDFLKSNGLLCFIATNNWVTSMGASKLRNKVVLESQIKLLIDFGNFMVFENASIQTMIMLFSKNDVIDNYYFDYRRISGDIEFDDALDLLNKKPNDKATYFSSLVIRNKLKDKFLTFSSNEMLLDKIAEKGIYFTEKEIANGIVFPQDVLNKKNKEILGKNFFVGEGIFSLSEKEKEKLHLSKNELKLIKPYYTTKQIHRYYSEPKNELWLIYTDSSFKDPKSMDKYPKLKQHLDRFANIISSDNKPYGLHRTREERFFNGEKIIVLRKCVGQPSFSYSDFDCYVSATFYVIKTDRFNYKYLVGLLNSKLIAFWLMNKGKMQGSNYQVDKEPLLQIPIPDISLSQQKPIITLVDKILSKKKANPETDITELEKDIDKLVYEIYGLNKEEIDFIEGKG